MCGGKAVAGIAHGQDAGRGADCPAEAAVPRVDLRPRGGSSLQHKNLERGISSANNTQLDFKDNI